MDVIIQFIVLTALVLLVSILLYYKNAFNYWQKLGVPHLKPSFPLGNLESQFTKYLGQRVNQIAAHCFSFFFAGFESSATTISFCMFELAVNPNIQDKVRAEITSVLEKYNGHMTYDAISELRYLDQVIHGMKLGIVESKIAISRMIKNYKFFLHPKIKLPLKLLSVGPIIGLDEPILLLTEKI
ncbi:Cytochrome P450 6a19 [Carabus blaptoides fortunei]